VNAWHGVALCSKILSAVWLCSVLSQQFGGCFAFTQCSGGSSWGKRAAVFASVHADDHTAARINLRGHPRLCTQRCTGSGDAAALRRHSLTHSLQLVLCTCQYQHARPHCSACSAPATCLVLGTSCAGCLARACSGARFVLMAMQCALGPEVECALLLRCRSGSSSWGAQAAALACAHTQDHTAARVLHLRPV
jgi:hypothetical protein